MCSPRAILGDRISSVPFGFTKGMYRKSNFITARLGSQCRLPTMPSESVVKALTKAAKRAAKIAEADASGGGGPEEAPQPVNPPSKRKEAQLEEAKETSR